MSQATNVTTPHEGKIVADALAGLIEEVKGQQERFADCKPLGWTTWPLALAEEVGKVAQAVLHREPWGTSGVRVAALSVAAAAFRFVVWMDATNSATANAANSTTPKAGA